MIPAVTMQNNLAGMYLFIHTRTGRIYVGSSKCLKLRFRDHRSALRKGKHHNKFLQEAYDDDIRFIIKIYITENVEDAKNLEQKYLDENMKSGNLFNVASDARSPNKNRQHSESTILKMREAKLGKTFHNKK